MLKITLKIAAGLLTLFLMAAPAQAIRIKDMAAFEGVRGNQLIGYGLVVGLNGSGDKAAARFTIQGLANMLTRMGVKVTAEQMAVKNVAAVMITATLPPFARAGQRIDVTLSSLGDATNLAGGTLVMTPLRAMDGKIYVMAQGPVSTGGFLAAGEAASVQKNHPTVGRIPRGGTVERETPFNLRDMRTLNITLDVADFTTANRVAKGINAKMPGLKARAVDPATVQVKLPLGKKADLVGLMAKMENLEITPDISAKVIIEERTGTVVMGEAVRVSTVAVANGSLSISITEDTEVSQALPFAQGGETVETPTTEIEVGEKKVPLTVVKSGASIADVVNAINALGATPRDLITILQAIKAAGALQATLEII